MSLPDNNLRRLSASFARGLADKSTYRKLRTAQLSALEFNRKLPDLPAEMTNIVIPKQKIDVPHQPPSRKSSGGNGFLITMIILLMLGAGAAAYFLLA